MANEIIIAESSDDVFKCKSVRLSDCYNCLYASVRLLKSLDLHAGVSGYFKLFIYVI